MIDPKYQEAMLAYHIILEPTLFNTLNFVVLASSRETALDKLRGWCAGQVTKTFDMFDGEADQNAITASTKSYWDTGLYNHSVLTLLGNGYDVRTVAKVCHCSEKEVQKIATAAQANQWPKVRPANK